MLATGSLSSTRPCATEERGGFHWVVDAQGRLDPSLGDEKHVYGTAFAVYAASTVRAVTGDELALKMAKDAFDWLEQHAHDSRHGGYFEAIDRDGTPILSWKADAPAAPADGSPRSVLRLQVDEFAYSPSGSPDRAYPGSTIARSCGNGCARPIRSCATALPSSPAP